MLLILLSVPKFTVLHLLKEYSKSILKQMQYKFTVNFGSLSKSSLTFPGSIATVGPASELYGCPGDNVNITPDHGGIYPLLMVAYCMSKNS